MQRSWLQKKWENIPIYICVVVSAFGVSKMFMRLVVIIVLWSFNKQIISWFCVSSIRDTHRNPKYVINISELYIMPPQGWQDYRPTFSSLNRPHFHCWAESQSDWLGGVFLRPGILQGRQQRQWNSVDETACVEVMVIARSWIESRSKKPYLTSCGTLRRKTRHPT